MPALISFMRSIVCQHDWEAPIMGPNYLAKQCRRCKKVRLGRPLLRAREV